jgi:uncharacterized membrane protein
MPKSTQITEDSLAPADGPESNGHEATTAALLVASAPTPESEATVITRADRAPRYSLITIGLLCALLTGFLLRLSSAERLSSHVDESASVMAAQMVADKGVPVFPSGTLYLQGATISYLLAPVIQLGYGGIDHLTELRMLSVIAGTLAILALFMLTRWLTQSPLTALGVSALLAIDPASVRWGGLVRMYALLQLVALVMLVLSLRLLRSPGSRNLILGFIAVFWFGVFTHIAICLFLPPMLILAAWKHRLALAGRRMDLTIALAGACAAPVTLLVLNRLVTPQQATPAGTTSGVSFVGDYLLSLNQILHPSLKSWMLLFTYDASGKIIPYLIIGVSLILFGRYFLDANLAGWKVRRRNVLAVLMTLYWLPILFVAAFANENNERYLLHLHPLGLILIGFAAQELIVGERVRPALSFAPAAGTMALPGTRIEVVGERFAPTLQWLTPARVYAAAVSFAIGVGAVLRLWGYNRLSMWLDEGFSLLYSKQEWAAAAGFHGFYSPHPPLYFTLIKVFNLVLPDVSAGRTVAVLCGVLVLPVFYLLARRLLDPVAALVATTVFMLSPIHIYYSQEARMYSLVVLAVTTSFLALVGYIQTLDRRWTALYGVSLAVAVYADYSSLFVLAPQAAVLLFYAWRYRGKMTPMLIAAGLAVLAYVPWLPQVWNSVNSANEDERRADYLGAGFKRIMIIVLRITGISSDNHGAYFPSLAKTPWDRLHDLQSLILIAMAPVVILGVVGLWQRWTAMAIVFSFLGCIVVAVIVSLLSPGFAERTILSAAVGWSLLLGAAFNGRINRQRTPLAAASLLVVLVLCLGTIGNIHASAVKQRWDAASADLAMVSPLEFPVVTYSYGAVADTLVEAYEPGLLDSMRLITVRDGELEKTLSNDTIPQKGITIADINAGKLGELLPNSPDNDVIWYLYYQRRGEEFVRAGIERAGYVRIIDKVYDAPRGLVFLDLYARPGAALGDPVEGIPSYVNAAAWGIPAGRSPVQASEDGTSVAITNQSRAGTAVVTQVKTGGRALYTVDVDVQSRLLGSSALVKLTCQTQAGGVLNELTAGTQGTKVNDVMHHQSAIYCPEETAQVRITLTNLGNGEMTFMTPTLRKLAIPDRE